MISQVFQIGTLRDIFNLPTLSQMETCLHEMSEAMIQARIANDVMVTTMREAGATIERAFEWPESSTWTDDGLGEVGTGYLWPDGNEMFSISNKVTPSTTKESSP